MAGVTNTQIYKELVGFRDETRTVLALHDKRLSDVECRADKNNKTLHGNGDPGMDEHVRTIEAKIGEQNSKIDEQNDKIDEQNDKIDKQNGKIDRLIVSFDAHISSVADKEEAEENRKKNFKWWWKEAIAPYAIPILILVTSVFLGLQ